jgi:hypothetical protein
MQGSGSCLCVPCVDGRTLRKQHFDNLEVAAPGSIVQGGAAQRIARIHVGAPGENASDALDIAGSSGYVEFIGAQPVGC